LILANVRSLYLWTDGATDVVVEALLVSVSTIQLFGTVVVMGFDMVPVAVADIGLIAPIGLF
jgi:hypothetical protein